MSGKSPAAKWAGFVAVAGAVILPLFYGGPGLVVGIALLSFIGCPAVMALRERNASAFPRPFAAGTAGMRVVPRAVYHEAKARHKRLHTGLHAFMLALILYGLFFGWTRTGNPGLHDHMLQVGRYAEDLLSPLIPAIDNLSRAYHADGYSSRTSFARHVAAMGWLFGLAGIFAFFPMLWADRKFIKRRKSVLRVRKRSGLLAILWVISAFALCLFGAWFFFYGEAYNVDKRGGIEWMIMIRKYDLSAGGAMVFPFGSMLMLSLVIVHMPYCFKAFEMPHGPDHDQNFPGEERLFGPSR